MKLSLKKYIESYERILVTGGGGFIGGSMIRTLLSETNTKICNFDKMGYCSDFSGIDNLIKNESSEDKMNLSSRYVFFKGDLINKEKLENVFIKFKPKLVLHFAAESHVDRSIDDPENFINSNIIGTFNLLEIIRKNNFKDLTSDNYGIKLIHISTDEVFGSIDYPSSFKETSPYDPRSPYSASKASSDHLVNAWHHTYGLETIITNCCNNYGPWQFPEKLIPLSILKALNNTNIPIYGDGQNIRDWIFIEDHISALLHVVAYGQSGSRYCIGSSNEITNLELVEKLCNLLDKFDLRKDKYSNLITFVSDRAGHDKRYSIDYSLLVSELGWEPSFKLDEGLTKTIEWYLKNLNWCYKVMKKSNFKGERLGKNLLSSNF
mgnify:CR=1 FL=1